MRIIATTAVAVAALALAVLAAVTTATYLDQRNDRAAAIALIDQACSELLTADVALANDQAVAAMTRLTAHATVLDPRWAPMGQALAATSQFSFANQGSPGDVITDPEAAEGQLAANSYVAADVIYGICEPYNEKS